MLSAIEVDGLDAATAREIVRIDLAALAHISEPVLRRLALAGLQRCARSQPAYLRELHDQL